VAPSRLGVAAARLVDESSFGRRLNNPELHVKRGVGWSVGGDAPKRRFTTASTVATSGRRGCQRAAGHRRSAATPTQPASSELSTGVGSSGVTFRSLGWRLARRALRGHRRGEVLTTTDR
jgi:hypothetical protein